MNKMKLGESLITAGNEPEPEDLQHSPPTREQGGNRAFGSRKRGSKAKMMRILDDQLDFRSFNTVDAAWFENHLSSGPQTMELPTTIREQRITERYEEQSGNSSAAESGRILA